MPNVIFNDLGIAPLSSFQISSSSCFQHSFLARLVMDRICLPAQLRAGMASLCQSDEICNSVKI